MQDLNEAQRQAVTAGDGPALVLAGAGSGKTRVIVERLVWLVEERGVDPRSLLALTFTNRAAGEMKARVAQRLGFDRLAAWVGTFHSFGAYVLRREIDKLGRPKAFTIYDDTDQLSLMKRLIKALPASYEQVSPREALAWISRLKQDLAEPRRDTPGDPAEDTCRLLWRRYHAALEGVSAVDFDDLLVLLARLLQEHADVRDRYQRRYRHVLIDEYQDTNRAQYVIARSLCEAHGNLFVVGDEDQSIYSWRGADLRNILEFEQDFPNAKVFRLEQNYRSTAPILDVANVVVVHNEHRLGKTLWTAKAGAEPVRHYCAADGQDEARFVVDDIVRRNLAPRDVAVLYRVNGQSRLMEEALRRRGLACVVLGGVRFYARKEIKDLLSYLRLLVNPLDEVSLRRVINVPTRGIGSTTLAHLDDYGATRHLPLFQVLREIEGDQGLSARARGAVGAFVQIIDDLTLKAKGAAVAELLESVLERTGYRDYVRASDEKDFRARLEVVDEFVTACTEFDRTGRPGALEAFLQDLALLTDLDEWDGTAPAVTLMTCHSAKGLEFDHVFLIGLEKGLLPHATALESEEEIEEERRLCYVAMTRARETLTLTSAERRLVYGREEGREPSRFLDEIPKDMLAPVRREGLAAPGARTHSGVKPGALKLGTRVRHARFGEGVVMFTKGSGSKLKARIRFPSGQTRTFVVDRAPLEILEDDAR